MSHTRLLSYSYDLSNEAMFMKRLHFVSLFLHKGILQRHHGLSNSYVGSVSAVWPCRP